LNVVVRSYIINNQYDQAATLMAKTGYSSEINQSQTVRWLYYLARVRAVQLDYAGANRYLSLCIRRAPKDSIAPGFIQAVSFLDL
jgi:26S proteasome regulatory subunit N3